MRFLLIWAFCQMKFPQQKLVIKWFLNCLLVLSKSITNFQCDIGIKIIILCGYRIFTLYLHIKYVIYVHWVNKHYANKHYNKSARKMLVWWRRKYIGFAPLFAGQYKKNRFNTNEGKYQLRPNPVVSRGFLVLLIINSHSYTARQKPSRKYSPVSDYEIVSACVIGCMWSHIMTLLHLI